MPRSQAGKAAGSASFGSADQVARNASWTTSSARCRSWIKASAEPKARCWYLRVSSTKALMSPSWARQTSGSRSIAGSFAPLRCRETLSAFTAARRFLRLCCSPLAHEQDGDIEGDLDRLRLGVQRCQYGMAGIVSHQDDVAHRVRGEGSGADNSRDRGRADSAACGIAIPSRLFPVLPQEAVSVPQF